MHVTRTAGSGHEALTPSLTPFEGGARDPLRLQVNKCYSSKCDYTTTYPQISGTKVLENLRRARKEPSKEPSKEAEEEVVVEKEEEEEREATVQGRSGE